MSFDDVSEHSDESVNDVFISDFINQVNDKLLIGIFVISMKQCRDFDQEFKFREFPRNSFRLIGFIDSKFANKTLSLFNYEFKVKACLSEIGEELEFENKDIIGFFVTDKEKRTIIEHLDKHSMELVEIMNRYNNNEIDLDTCNELIRASKQITHEEEYSFNLN